MEKEFSVKAPEGFNLHKLRDIYNQLVEEMPVQIMLQVQVAKLTRAKYLALLEQGFTKEEALQLCK